jgi:hypothetical protein
MVCKQADYSPQRADSFEIEHAVEGAVAAVQDVAEGRRRGWRRISRMGKVVAKSEGGRDAPPQAARHGNAIYSLPLPFNVSSSSAHVSYIQHCTSCLTTHGDAA